MSTKSTETPRRPFDGARPIGIPNAFGNAVRRLHACQAGTISILSVFAVMFLTMLLGMVMNTGRHVDTKIRLQNAVDAATYSATGCLARGMNATAFTNHMLCEVFALTAIFRVSVRGPDPKPFADKILGTWDRIAGMFPGLGLSSQQDSLQVKTFTRGMRQVAPEMLRLLEPILTQELIPQYQRAVVRYWPDVAQQTMMEVAKHNGLPLGAQGELQGVLWRTGGVPVGGGYEATDPTLPIVDPTVETEYLQPAQNYRRALAMAYRYRYIRYRLMPQFYTTFWMSQLNQLWLIISCGHLDDLLRENDKKNLPFLLRDEGHVDHRLLERRFCFLGVVYRKKLPEMLPGLFRNPADSDELAYAEGRLFVPALRLEWHYGWWWDDVRQTRYWGYHPGYQARGGISVETARNWWGLFTQNWVAQLGPAGHDSLATILSTPPLVNDIRDDLRVPNLGGLDSSALERISPH